jgi:hypothetical protein
MKVWKSDDIVSPPALCDPALLLLSPAQARLNFGSDPAHPQLFNEGPETRLGV